MEDKLALTHHEEVGNEKTVFGFWIYLMTDLLMFAVLFACYAVLHTSTFGGPNGRQLFDLPNVLTETLILLTSSFTCGLGMIAAQKGNVKQTLFYFGITFILGASFLFIELHEFSGLIKDGHSFTNSAFLSSFFALVGTHGLHIFSGLLWMAILLVYIGFRGITKSIVRKLTLLSLFWHFLDIVWIFIFTVVYLLGAINI